MIGAVRVQPEHPLVWLDLKAPGAVSELKTAMGMCPHMLAVVFGPEPKYDEGFFLSDVWDAQATEFAEEWLARYLEGYRVAPAAGYLKEPHLYPLAKTVVLVMQLLGYRQGTSTVDFSKFPQLTAFFDEIGGDSSRGAVEAPFFSEAEMLVPSMKAIVVGLSVFAVVVWLFVKEK